jgi:hypothetical protein
MESQMCVGFIRCILRGAHPFLLYLSASEMIPTFTFTKNDLACFSFGGQWPARLREMIMDRHRK